LDKGKGKAPLEPIPDLSESEDLPEIPDVITECNANKGKSRAAQDVNKAKGSDKEGHSDSTYPHICIE
jgi:hypothetical protein